MRNKYSDKNLDFTLSARCVELHSTQVDDDANSPCGTVLLLAGSATLCTKHQQTRVRKKRKKTTA